MTIAFTEVTSDDVETVRRERRNQFLERAIRKILRRPGANIMVMGIGGAGRNAIRHLQQNDNLHPSVELVTLDTQTYSDQELYS